MLKEIWIENFKSINKEQIFSMEACPKSEISEFPEHILNLGDTKLLKVASMYGPNGSGKSNLLEAIRLFKLIVKGNPCLSNSPSEATYLSSIFSKSNESKFTFIFETLSYELKYQLFVDITKSIIKERGRIIEPFILKESLDYFDKSSKKKERVFERDSNGNITSERFKMLDLIKSKTKLAGSNTFVSYIVTTFLNSNNSESLYSPIFFLKQEVDSIYVLQREPFSYYFDKATVDSFEKNKEKIINSLNKLDIKIKDIKFVKNEYSPTYDLYIVRNLNNSINELPLSRESNGTKKLIALFFDILLSQDNRLYLADDFDAYLHPKLIAQIIDLFNCKENKNKQIILNSHDIVNMNKYHFRRDEIWFSFRDENFQTIYVPLSNIYDFNGKQIRKDAKYGKQYLEGRYGADPFISDGLNWENIK